MARTATAKIRAPRGGAFHRVVGSQTICGIDAGAWKHAEKGDEVTCQWCRIRERHGVTTPTRYTGLSDEAKADVDKETARRKRAAKRKRERSTR